MKKRKKRKNVQKGPKIIFVIIPIILYGIMDLWLKENKRNLSFVPSKQKWKSMKVRTKLDEISNILIS